MMTGGGGGGVACGACLLAVESGSGNGSRVSVRVCGWMVSSTVRYGQVLASGSSRVVVSFPLTLL